MATKIEINNSNSSNYLSNGKLPNIPSLEILRRAINPKDYLDYPYEDNGLVFIGEKFSPHKPLPQNLNIGTGCIFHQTRKIHLAAADQLTFSGRFMAAPTIILEATNIELSDSFDDDEPITTIAAQVKLVLNCSEIFLNGIELKCYDASIDCRAKTIRYANIDLDHLKNSAKFPPSCKFLEVEIIDD
ncbi:MAG: hypothetical protein JSR58_05590 [Verrucomicrobia bacterium]|nr:hypothetical protein [Verrucomicrobiota bacterium]